MILMGVVDNEKKVEGEKLRKKEVKEKFKRVENLWKVLMDFLTGFFGIF